MPARDLAFYDEVQRKQVVRNGTYRLLVGPDAATVAGSTDVRISGDITPRVAYVSVQPDRTQLTPGDTLNLTGQNPWIADETLRRGLESLNTLDALKMAIWRRESQDADLRKLVHHSDWGSSIVRFVTLSDSPGPSPSHLDLVAACRRWAQEHLPTLLIARSAYENHTNQPA